MVFGARPWRCFFEVMLPNVWPAVLGAFLVSFILAFNNFEISFYNLGAIPTLPTIAWGTLRHGIEPELRAGLGGQRAGLLHPHRALPADPSRFHPPRRARRLNPRPCARGPSQAWRRPAWRRGSVPRRRACRPGASRCGRCRVQLELAPPLPLAAIVHPRQPRLDQHVRKPWAENYFCFTPRSRPSWWCRRKSVPDPACVKMLAGLPV